MSESNRSLWEVLREYQREAVKAFLEAKKGIVVLPTGSGKTYVAVQALITLANQGQIDRFIVAVPTIALALQWENILTQFGFPAKAYLSGGPVKTSRTTSNIFPYPTFIKVAESIKGHTAAIDQFLGMKSEQSKIFLIIDEVHHAHKGTKLYDAVKDFPAEYVLGLTATLPKKEESNYPFPVVYRKTYADLLKFIPKVDFTVVMLQPDANFMMEYRSLTNRIKQALKVIESSTATPQQKREADETYKRLVGRRFTLVSMYDKVLLATANLVATLSGKVLVFTMRVEAMRELTRFLRSMIKKKVIPIMSQEDVLKLRSQEWDVIIAARRLGEGVDLPEVDKIVLSSYPVSLRTLVQEVGRGMRGSPKKVLEIYSVVVRDTYTAYATLNLMKFLGVKVPKIYYFESGELVEQPLLLTEEEKEEGNI